MQLDVVFRRILVCIMVLPLIVVWNPNKNDSDWSIISQIIPYVGPPVCGHGLDAYACRGVCIEIARLLRNVLLK
jgi:hypothetical protein